MSIKDLWVSYAHLYRYIECGYDGLCYFEAFFFLPTMSWKLNNQNLDKVPNQRGNHATEYLDESGPWKEWGRRRNFVG